MTNLKRDTDKLSDHNVWTAILYLDPERDSHHADAPVLVPLIACFTFCFIFLAGLCALTQHARGDDAEVFSFSGLK